MPSIYDLETQLWNTRKALKNLQRKEAKLLDKIRRKLEQEPLPKDWKWFTGTNAQRSHVVYPSNVSYRVPRALKRLRARNARRR